jgi:hypothetical protein
MDTLKETSTQETILSGYQLVSLEPTHFHGIELPFVPEESPLMKAPINYQSEYTAIELPVDTLEEEIVEITTSEPECVQPEEGFLETLRHDITSLLNITKVEAEETLPFLEVKKEML